MDDYTPSSPSANQRYLQDATRPYVAVPFDLFPVVAEIGTTAGWVYLYLKMRAGNKTTCFPSAQTIADDLGLSEKTVRTALTTLRERGMITVERRTTTAGHKTSSMITIQDTPGNFYQSLAVKSSVGLAVKITDEITTDNELTKEEHTYDHREEKITAPRFTEFWSAWPKKVDKINAEHVWAKLSDTEKRSAVECLASYLPYFQSIDRNYIPSPAKWLRAKHWLDEDVPAPARSQNGHVEQGHVYRRFKKQNGEEY